jgi:hypothetical protein
MDYAGMRLADVLAGRPPAGILTWRPVAQANSTVDDLSAPSGGSIAALSPIGSLLPQVSRVSLTDRVTEFALDVRRALLPLPEEEQA